MIRKKFVIRAKYGVHLRPAVRIYETIKDYKSKVEIKKNDVVADARSTLGVMLLGMMPGDVIEVIVNGVDEEEVMQKLTDLIDHKNFGEEEDD
ncbi:MAG: HPr family phosphocarrier protein [Brevinematales bacterium]|nr:HPr family phosphocarrier protein [Brevinematales bacterium]